MIYPNKLKNGRYTYTVRYLAPEGKYRTKTFNRKRDAERFEYESKMQRQGVLPAPDRQVTVRELWKRYDKLHLGVNVSDGTRKLYGLMYRAHIDPAFGTRTVWDLVNHPEIVDDWFAELITRKGNASVRKTLMVFSAMMEHAIRWRMATYNPIRALKPPSGKRKRAVRPATIDEIHAIREQCDPRSGLLVALCGFAGLRPSEALALTWDDILDHTIIVDKACIFGEIRSTKTGQVRAVSILSPLTDILSAFHDVTEGDLLLPSNSGAYWTDDEYRVWRRRVFTPAVERSGVKIGRVYDLRHSFASRLIAEGNSVIDVADQLGHGAQLCLNTYAHLFSEQRARSRSRIARQDQA